MRPAPCYNMVYATDWCRPRSPVGGCMSTATTAAVPAKKRGSGLLQGLQKVGRSLQLPIAVLPAAGILLRLGQDDVFGKDGLGWNKVAAVFATAGDAVFSNLPLLFCV